jgi:hypothetical protein
VELLLNICSYLVPGSADLLAMSRVSQAWRRAITGAPLLWSCLIISRLDKSPGRKAWTFVKRSGHVGLKQLEIDMTFNFDDPNPRPKRVSARNNQKSTFQQILHAIDSATKTGVVHQLDLIKYYSEGAWHGFDMTYLVRFLLRPYVQPRRVHILSDDVTCNWSWYRAVPLLPAFNPHLEEFLVKGRAFVRYRFSTEPVPLIARLYNLKMTHIGLVESIYNGKEDIVSILHGLRRAAHERPFKALYRGPENLDFTAVSPGVVDLALVHVELLLDGWTTADRHVDKDILKDTTPPILLPCVRELILGVDNFDILGRFKLPSLEVLMLRLPMWMPFTARFGAVARAFIEELRRIGSNIRILDISHSGLGRTLLILELHTVCPVLEDLRVDCEAFGVQAKHTIIPYIKSKAASTIGTRRLKTLCGSYKMEEGDSEFIQAHVDNYIGPGHRESVTLAFEEEMEDLLVDRYESRH